MRCKQDGGDEMIGMYQAQELLMKAKMKLRNLLRMLLTLAMVMGLLPATAMRGPSGRNGFRVLTDLPEAAI